MRQPQTTSERIDDLLKESGKPLGVIAKEIGVSASLLSELRNKDTGLLKLTSGSELSDYKRRDRDIRSSNLVKICEYFKVSADYLLCLSDVKARNMTIAEINRETGLSEDAITALIIDAEFGEQTAKFISFLIKNKYFRELIGLINKRNGSAPQGSVIVDAGISYEVDAKEMYQYLADKLIWKILKTYEPGK